MALPARGPRRQLPVLAGAGHRVRELPQPGVGTLARAGNSVAGAFLVGYVVLFCGRVVYFFYCTLQREFGPEFSARVWLQRGEQDGVS